MWTGRRRSVRPTATLRKVLWPCGYRRTSRADSIINSLSVKAVMHSLNRTEGQRGCASICQLQCQPKCQLQCQLRCPLKHLQCSPILGTTQFPTDRKSTRLNSSHTIISYAVFCLKKKT